MNNDELALERTKLANERTLLAYSRTAVMVFATGVTSLKLLAEDSFFQIMGWILIPLSAIIFVYGVFSFIRINRRLHK
ncbi:MAG: DUF202 domain-containing protein [Bacteroidota bacterium]